MNSFQATASPGQIHSSDCLTRLPASVLGLIVFEHLESAQEGCVLLDAKRAVPGDVRRAGITEWKAQLGQTVLSLGWDWVELRNGQIQHLQTVPPRANFLIIDAKGYDQTDDSIELAALVARLPWHLAVRESILESTRQYGIYSH